MGAADVGLGFSAAGRKIDNNIPFFPLLAIFHEMNVDMYLVMQFFSYVLRI